MKIQSKYLLLALPIILAFFSLGCGMSGMLGQASKVEPTPTRTPLPTFTPTSAGVASFITVAPITPQPMVTPTAEQIQPESGEVDTSSPEPESSPKETEPTPTATLVVQPSPTPEPLPTDTPAPASPMVIVQQNMNVRGGPGTNYPVVGSATQGDNSKMTGRNDDGSWIQVEYPSADGKGWVYTSLVDVSGDASSLPVAQASMDPLPPAPPTPVPPVKEEAPPPPPEPQYQFMPAEGWHASENPGIVHFKGRIKDGQGNLVNGYSILLDNWAWKVLSHPTGPSHWYPEKGPGEWDVVFSEIRDGQGWWWMSVVIYQCDFASAFDSQCKNYQQLSAEHKIEVVSPEESIINADWICNWDCDKGVYRSWSKDEGYR
jgi:uncharacterized protein YraI